MENNDQDGMPNGDGCSLLATSSGEASILSGEIRLLGPACCKCGLNQELAEPGATFVGPATCAFARTFVISRAHPCPRCQMFGTGKPIHIHTNFGQAAFSTPLANASNATEQNHRLCQAQRLFVGWFSLLL